MAEVVQTKKKIALLHRHPKDRIKETNAAFPYLQAKGIDVLTFKTFPRTGNQSKFWKSLLWIFYAPLLVLGKGYDVIYCDDSYPFYPILVKIASPKSKIVLRIGDFHLMYYYSGWKYKFLHFFEKIGWIMADEIIVISEAMAEEMGRGCISLGYVRVCIAWKDVNIIQKIKVVLDPVDPKDFPIDGNKNYGSVMFHGTLTKNKNVDILLEAAKRLPQVNFIVIGEGPDRARLESIAPHNVFFKGWVPFHLMHKHISTCAVGVALRSDNPGNEYVVTSPFLQYGVMGKPCLVTRRKVFGDYQWQFSGVDEMVEKIEKIMMAPYAEGQKLREYILKNHDAEKIAGEIWKILESV